jgi:hypothetical protein
MDARAHHGAVDLEEKVNMRRCLRAALYCGGSTPCIWEPEFSGYTPQSYQAPFDERMVEVATADPSQVAPDAPGYYPPNMIKRMLKPPLDANNYQEMGGLKCYPGIPTSLICYGRRDPVTNEDILLQVDVPPYGPGTRSPLIQARYFTPVYGGLTIAWRANAKNLSQWREIDAQVWKFIASWNVANSVDIKGARLGDSE